MITLSVARYYKNEETKQTSSRIRIHLNLYCFDPSLVSIYLLFNFSFCSDASITSYIKQLNPLLLVIFRNQVSGDSCYSIYKYFPDWPMTNSLTLNHHYIPFHLFFFFSRIYFFDYLQQAISQNFSDQDCDKEDCLVNGKYCKDDHRFSVPRLSIMYQNWL